MAIALLCAACGGGDDGGGGGSGSNEPNDAPSGNMSDGAAVGDGQSGGTQGPGQFCEVTAQGPYCQAGLTCCMSDKICRIATDCPGSTGFIMCVKLADCPNGNVCCQTTSQTFCTKKSACDSYGGTELP